jgi:hypothetical protein
MFEPDTMTLLTLRLLIDSSTNVSYRLPINIQDKYAWGVENS